MLLFILESQTQLFTFSEPQHFYRVGSLHPVLAAIHQGFPSSWEAVIYVASKRVQWDWALSLIYGQAVPCRRAFPLVNSTLFSPFVSPNSWDYFFFFHKEVALEELRLTCYQHLCLPWWCLLVSCPVPWNFSKRMWFLPSFLLNLLGTSHCWF